MNIRATISTALVSLAGFGASAASAVDPYELNDRTWISLSGTIVDTRPNHFTLDYGHGLITVEMDDWDRHDEAQTLLGGDRVTVTGRMDVESHQQPSIEARRVYVRDNNTFYYASDADEESTGLVGLYPFEPAERNYLSVTGTVTTVAVHGSEFAIDTPSGVLRIDTKDMAYNPLDDEGIHQIRVGDYVSVTGELADDPFESREIKAEHVITLSPGSITRDDANKDKETS